MITNEQIEKALNNSLGIISAAADQLGCTRQNLSQRILKSKALKKILLNAQETSLDLAESKLLKNIKLGKEASIFFYLKTRGKVRGYVEKTEIDQKSDISGEITVKKRLLDD